MTDSMKQAIGETDRRRAKQVAFNESHGITPKGVTKKVKDLIDGVYDQDEIALAHAAEERSRYETMSEKDAAREIKRLEKQMLEHARNLEFEKAAEVRDRLQGLKRSVFGADGAEHERLRAAG
jgi:excinuclease ABC subunit B